MSNATKSEPKVTNAAKVAKPEDPKTDEPKAKSVDELAAEYDAVAIQVTNAAKDCTPAEVAAILRGHNPTTESGREYFKLKTKKFELSKELDVARSRPVEAVV